MADISEPASLPLARMCQIDGRVGAETSATIRS